MSPPSAVRQHGHKLTDIRHDHRARYTFATTQFSGNILDAACGIGYGSYIMAMGGLNVVACDVSEDAIAEGTKYFDHSNIEWYIGDARVPQNRTFDGIACFEALEHMRDPELALSAFKLMLRVGGILVASVPNEDVMPFNADQYATDEYPHIRHYRPNEFAEILNGFHKVERFTQQGKYSDVEPGDDGRTLVYVCIR